MALSHTKVYLLAADSVLRRLHHIFCGTFHFVRFRPLDFTQPSISFTAAEICVIGATFTPSGQKNETLQYIIKFIESEGVLFSGFHIFHRDLSFLNFLFSIKNDVRNPLFLCVSKLSFKLRVVRIKLT